MQTLIYNPTNSAIQLKTIKNIEWKNGCYKFTNISLQQLILKINEIYTPDIYLNKDIDGSCEFTGSICHHETQDKVIEKICYSLNLQKKNINGKILLYNLH